MAITLNASTSSGLVQTADTSGTIDLQSAGATKLSVTSTGTSIAQYNPAASLITSGTAVSASGTSVNFTGIPSWVKRVTVNFNGVSTNGTSLLLAQLGTVSGIETSTYNSASGSIGVAGATANTSGFLLSNAITAAANSSGIIVFASMGSNLWSGSGNLSRSDGAINLSAGSKTLSGTLDRVRITTVNGTDTFDAGSINILYE
jgi:hypothetical protein